MLKKNFFYPASAPVMALLLIVSLSLSGCVSVGPDYSPPQIETPGQWRNGLAETDPLKVAEPAVLASWWQKLDDPLLTELIQDALSSNLDLRQALARVRESRARLGISSAGQYPTLDASGAVTRSRGSENLGSGGERDRYSAGFDAGWELDIFGGVRRSVEAAEADLAAGEQDLRDVWVSLAAETARNYVQVRILQQRLTVALENLQIQEQTFDLARWRYESGMSDELAAKQALYSLETTRAQLPGLRIDLEAAMNRLAVLLGKPPGALHDRLAAPQPVPKAPGDIVVGVPADTLRRRPDVARAERQLAAQTARIGVATAELYPKLRLSGSIGVEALNSSDLFTTGSRTYSMGPGISWRIFDAGAIRRQIKAQTAVVEAYAVKYEAAVLVALEEVENALTAYIQEQQRLQALDAAAAAAHEAFVLARDKYQAGLIDFGNVLDSQRSLLSLQDNLVQSRGAVTTHLIQIYKALGGGWERINEEATKEQDGHGQPNARSSGSGPTPRNN